MIASCTGVGLGFFLHPCAYKSVCLVWGVHIWKLGFLLGVGFWGPLSFHFFPCFFVFFFHPHVDPLFDSIFRRVFEQLGNWLSRLPSSWFSVTILSFLARRYQLEAHSLPPIPRRPRSIPCFHFLVPVFTPLFPVLPIADFPDFFPFPLPQVMCVLLFWFYTGDARLPPSLL